MNVAARFGHIEILKYIFTKGGLPRSEDYLITALNLSAFNGHFEVVKYLVSQGVNTQDTNPMNGMNAICRAATNGHFEIVGFLLEHGAQIRECLICAVRAGQLEMVKYLVSKGDNLRNEYNDDVLIIASSYGDLEIVKYLVEQGANHKSDFDSPIFCASLQGHFNIVKYFINEKKINIQTVYFQRRYLLRLCARFGHFEIIRFLMKNGLDADEHSIDNSKFFRYISFCDDMERKQKLRAQKKIYYWWISICYDLHHPSGCGKRMAERNWSHSEKGEMI